MKSEFRKRFISDMKGIKNKSLADDIQFIIDSIHKANSISGISGVKKLAGHKDYYRVRIEDYRIGIKVSGNTAIFICLLHRSDIYKQFP